MTTSTWGPATLHVGDCIEVMREMPAESVHVVITDPPYGLDFMGQRTGWDAPWREARGEDAEHASAWPAHHVAPPTLKQMRGFQDWTAQWGAEALRVLKPGGHLLAFGGSRTYHRMVTGLEDAGFEIRDLLAWVQAQGFAKSLNVGRAIEKKYGADHGGVAQWEGWGTQLRPSIEPIVLARKPVAGTTVDNVLQHGTGAIHIDAIRTPHASEADRAESEGKNQHADYGTEPGGNRVYGDYTMVPRGNYDGSKGRWPANFLMEHAEECAVVGSQEVVEGDPEPVLACATGCPAGLMDEQSGASTSRIGKPRSGRNGEGWGMTATGAEYDDAGGASRFFPAFRYEPKAPSREKPPGEAWHFTVKPLAIMEWLIRGFSAPGQVILDPFAGSGTTGEAVLRAGGGRSVAMIEREADYAALIASRMRRQVYDTEHVAEQQDAGLLF